MTGMGKNGFQQAISGRGFALALMLFGAGLIEAVPLRLNYQGQVLVDGMPFEGTARFKFVLLNQQAVSLWSQDNSSTGGGEPVGAIILPVARGLYSIRLGDTAVSGMAAIPGAIFTNEVIRLRVWFNDGTNGYQRLTPDREIGSVAFAVRADTARTVESIPAGIIGNQHLSAGLAGELAAMQARLNSLSNQLAGTSLPALSTASVDSEDPALLALGYERFFSMSPSRWINGSTVEGPLPRYRHSGTWIGNELIVWGGTFESQIEGDGLWAYRPASDQWRQLSMIDAPFERRSHTGIWTGTEVLFWGGFCFPGFEHSAGAYRPATDRWRTISPVNRPESRDFHAAIWTGSRMIIWGGRNESGALGDGRAYDPAADRWEDLPIASQPAARFEFAWAWAGDRLLLFGGTGADGGERGDGAQLICTNGVPSHWIPMSAQGAPSPRKFHSAVWTGAQLLVWGGSRREVFGDGAAFDPATDTWMAIPSVGAPSAREKHQAVWTGGEMLIHGGETVNGTTASAFGFDPVKQRWRSLAASTGGLARSEGSAFWTGAELLVYGGRDNGRIIGDVQRLNPQPPLHFFRKP